MYIRSKIKYNEMQTHKLNCKAQLLSRKSDPNKIYVIKQKSKALAYSEVHTQRLMNYIIGFSDITLARKVQYNIDPQPSLRLYRSQFEDVTDDVNTGLRELHVDTIVGKIVIDTNARLHIPKQDASLPPQMNDNMYHIETVDICDFMMYPFEKNLGIVMPYSIDIENNSEIVLLSKLVESSDSMASFRNSLNKLL